VEVATRGEKDVGEEVATRGKGQVVVGKGTGVLEGNTIGTGVPGPYTAAVKCGV
jgi:hypothetical protein